MTSLSILLLIAISLSRQTLVCSSSTSYVIKDSFKGNDFFNTWNWETFDDPTHGRVNYVDQATAKNTNLSYADDSKFVMRADSYEVVPNVDPSSSFPSRGRNSVRISSKSSYNDGLMILDLSHMPEGCGTWPAWWSLSATGPWPQGGEIDIIEGVNQNSQNLVSLHTSSSCSMAGQNRWQSGSTVSTDCDAAVNYNQGCGVASVKPNSYGSGFNSNGGGWFVLKRSKADGGIYSWFWARNDQNVPAEVRDDNCSGPISTDKWGQPDASFPTGDNCDYDRHFNEHKIVFDLTFCGDWAGNAFGTSGCGTSTCNDFVNNNPDRFTQAYWEINSLRVYSQV